MCCLSTIRRLVIFYINLTHTCVSSRFHSNSVKAPLHRSEFHELYITSIVCCSMLRSSEFCPATRATNLGTKGKNSQKASINSSTRNNGNGRVMTGLAGRLTLMIIKMLFRPQVGQILIKFLPPFLERQKVMIPPKLDLHRSSQHFNVCAAGHVRKQALAHEQPFYMQRVIYYCEFQVWSASTKT